MRKSVILAGCVLAAAALSGCSTADATPAAKTQVVVTHADYPQYASVKQVLGKADLVIRGRAVSSRVDELRPEGSDSSDPLLNPQAGVTPDPAAAADDPIVVTVVTVEVTDVLKGAAKAGDRIEVSQLGGQVGNVKYVDDTTTPLSTASSDDYVLMLAAYGPGKPYDLLNPVQAMYTVNASGTLRAVRTEGALPVGTLSGLRGDTK